MAIDYGNLAAGARRLIGSNGTKCALKNPAGEQPVYNADTDEYEKTEERFDGFCVVSNYEDRLFDGTAIKVGDRRVVAVLSGEPKPGISLLEVYDKAGSLKETYHVVNSTPVNPDASAVILYRLQCRK